jgi:hypothetical protein
MEKVKYLSGNYIQKYMRRWNFIHDRKESTTFPAAIFNETQQMLNNIM